MHNLRISVFKHTNDHILANSIYINIPRFKLETNLKKIPKSNIRKGRNILVCFRKQGKLKTIFDETVKEPQPSAGTPTKGILYSFRTEITYGCPATSKGHKLGIRSRPKDIHF